MKRNADMSFKSAPLPRRLSIAKWFKVTSNRVTELHKGTSTYCRCLNVISGKPVALDPEGDRQRAKTYALRVAILSTRNLVSIKSRCVPTTNTTEFGALACKGKTLTMISSRLCHGKFSEDM